MLGIGEELKGRFKDVVSLVKKRNGQSITNTALAGIFRPHFDTSFIYMRTTSARKPTKQILKFVLRVTFVCYYYAKLSQLHWLYDMLLLTNLVLRICKRIATSVHKPHFYCLRNLRSAKC